MEFPQDERLSEKERPAFITRKAHIEEIEIQLLESIPMQANVAVRGYLPDSCTNLDEITQQLQGDGFLITITTTRPADRNCLQVIRPFEKTILLDMADLKAGEYTVTVNQMTTSFTLETDNIDQE